VAAGQLPFPSQYAAAVKTPAVQLALRQPLLVGQRPHAPAPSQVPVLEQSPLLRSLALQRAFGSAPPDETIEQVPTLPETLQLLHRPPVEASLHALSQQTPSVQNVLAHWLPAVQAAPLGLRPHEPLMHALGAMQSLSVLQGTTQALPEHT
jgi:hypothetical protein